MPARKRGRQEAELDNSLVAVPEEPAVSETLLRLRNMWQFAAFMQYLFLFGKVVKVDENFDMDEFESECLKPEPSQRLQEVALALLKYVSSHRGLTMDIFDEYARRQYEAKAPLRNPFGEEEEPKRFHDFDVFTKVRVLHQLSVWTLGNADRIRQQMPEQTEREQTSWRIEELGWDKEERSYFVLDDDRLYRRTEAPIPPTPKKAKGKAKAKARKSRGTRSSKRRKLSGPPDSEDEQEEDGIALDVDDSQLPAEEDDFGGMKWECIAITLDDYQKFLETIRRSTDADEKVLRKRITDEILPVMEEQAEKQRQKALKRQREAENLQKLATAKRSSRLAGKKELEKQREEAKAAEKQELADLAMARKEQEKQRQMEEARESRMLTREQRLKEREVKRILHEEELKRLEENSKNMENSDARMSERNLKLEMERRQKELDKLAEEEDEWIFDCAVCGMHGENLDDGTHSIACEKCNIWQHSKCHGIREEDAEHDDFHFVCNDCVKKEEEARKPKIPPLRLRMGASNSPHLDRARPYLGPNGTPQPGVNGVQPIEGVFIYGQPRDQSPRPSSTLPHLMEGPALSPSGQSPGPPGYHSHGPPPVGVPQQAWNGATLPPPARAPSAGYTSSPPRPQSRNGSATSPPPPPPFQLHSQAHASAMSSSHLPHYQPYQLNGHNGSMPPPSPQKGGQSRPGSSLGYDSNARRTSLNGLNGSASTPQPRLSMSPNAHQLPSQALSYSPNTSFPPPSRPHQYQQAAGHSPTKQSSSPAHGGSQQHHTPLYTPSNSQNQHHNAATPQTQMTSASHQSIFRPSPGGPLHSSPIPPLPTGNTPLIPQKHDTPRPLSRDSIGEIPVLPPGIKMSPSPGASFVRPGSSSGNPPPAPTFSNSPLFQQQSSFENSNHSDSRDVKGGNTETGAGFPSLPSDRQVQPTSFGTPAATATPERRSPGHGEAVEGGGVRGVETEFGVGSVPVKKMMPQQETGSRPASSAGLYFTDVMAGSKAHEDSVMRDS